jgi:hypothetical protein
VRPPAAESCGLRFELIEAPKVELRFLDMSGELVLISHLFYIGGSEAAGVPT